jgi:D-3-phosphoglycerate dehydrogenase
MTERATSHAEAESGRRPTVVISERLGTLTEVERGIEATGALVRREPLWSAEQIEQHAEDADVVILGAVEQFDAKAMDAIPTLRAIIRRGVGHDNVDLTAATARGIIVANVPDASVEEVSDHALALLLSIERAIPWLDRAVRNGDWGRDPAIVESIRSPARRFGTLTLGVIGLGRIGTALARKSRSVYAKIVAFDPMMSVEAAAAHGVELVDLDALLGIADHISVHAPLLPGTRGMLNATTLGKLRPGTILVNTSRGGLVDEDSLIDAIDSGRLKGAGLDVTVTEPLETSDSLLSSPRILLTAHSAAFGVTSKLELATRSVDAALAVLNGEVPDTIVNPEVLTSGRLRR